MRRAPKAPLSPVLPATARNEAPAALLPYQQRWIDDDSPFKVIEKSRRTGLTWAEAADDVLIAGAEGGQNVYYIGYNQDMAIEYIDACGLWARTFDRAVGDVEEGLWDDETDRHIKTYTIRFASGRRIVALSSRPANLRGKQGVVVIDEAAFHERLDELLKAALALLIWGGKVRVISTHNGDANPFNDLIQQIRSFQRKGSVQRITFLQAVQEGLYRRVCLRLGRAWRHTEEDKWVASVYDYYGEDASEELDVVPKSGSDEFLNAVLIESCMDTGRPVLRWRCSDEFARASEQERRERCQQWIDTYLVPAVYAMPPDRPSYLGEDFGRSGDLTVLAPLQLTHNLVRDVPFLVELRNVPFRQQEQLLFWLLDRLPCFTKACLDATGNGSQLAEYAWQRYGESVVEALKLSEAAYLEIMPAFKAGFEEYLIRIPRDADVRQDLRSLKTIKGVTKLAENARRKGLDGHWRHGDAAIALALAWRASTQPAERFTFERVPRRSAAGLDNFSRRLQI